MLRICYVHGAGASPRSFNWLCDRLPSHTPKLFSYPIGESVGSVARRLEAELRDDVQTVLMGHSLGGVIAALCSELPNVYRLVTLCAPFGGVRYVDVMSLFSFEPLFHDLRPHGHLLSSLRHRSSYTPHLGIVGTSGLPFITEQNDGVVTVSSQTALSGAIYKMLPLNHFEVLLSSEVVNLVTEFIRI